MKYSIIIIILNLIYQWSNCIENCEISQTKTIEEPYCYKVCSKKILGICYEHDTICETRYSTKVVCTKCFFGYVLINENSCIKGIDNCFTYEENKNPPVCLECEDDYVILSNKCIPYNEGCIEYSEITYLCEKCDTNYILYGNSHLCLEKKSNCKTYYIENDKLYCRTCQPNYILSSNGNCYPTQNNGGDNSICSYSQIKNNGQCISQIENCVEYSLYSYINFSFCLKCKIGYFLQYRNCILEEKMSLYYYINFNNFYIKISFEINRIVEILKNRIPFNLNLQKQSNYYFSYFDSIEYQIFEEDYIQYSSTILSPGDIIMIYPNILAFVHSNYKEHSKYIKIGKIIDINILINIRSFNFITFYSSYVNVNNYCISSVYNPYSKFLTMEDMKIILFSRTSIPLNNVPNLYLNEKISIKNSCYLKENNMVVECDINPYKKQLNSKTNKVLESCDGCKNMLETEFKFDIETIGTDNALNYLELNRLLFYIFLILI